MHKKLQREEKEDEHMHEKLIQLDLCNDCTVFDYIRGVIDERNALIDQYERNLKTEPEADAAHEGERLPQSRSNQ